VKAEIRPRVKFLTFEAFVQQKENQPGLFETAMIGQGSGPPTKVAMDTPKGSQPTHPQPSGPGAEPILGVDESILRERYREFCRKEARRALDSVELFERGQKMKVIRAIY
jgi:hypothetical protein